MMLGDYSTRIQEFFDAGNALFLTLTSLIAKFIPLCVLFSVALIFTQLSGGAILYLVEFYGTVLFAIIMMIGIYCLGLLLLGGVSPVRFIKNDKEGMLTSFSTSSSSMSLPLNLKICTDKMGVSPKVANFSIPLGATINMDGTSITYIVTGLFLAKAYGIEISPSSYLLIGVTIILMSLGTPGVPGAGIVCMGIVLNAIGVPIEAIGVIIAVTPFTDMISTM